MSNSENSNLQIKRLQKEVAKLKEELKKHKSIQDTEADSLAESFHSPESEFFFNAELYQSIAETANEGIWVSDRQAITIFVNRRLTEMLGYTRDEMIGKKAYDFMDNEAREIASFYLARRLQGHADRYEQKYIHKDGSEVWVLISASAIKAKSGDVVASLGMLTNITSSRKAEMALKESEEKFFCSFQSSPNALALCRMDNTVIVDVNDAFVSMFGISKEEVIGKTSSFLDIFESEEARVKLGTKLLNTGSVRNFEAMLKRRTRGKIHALISVETLRISSGSLSLTTIQDITGLKQIEKTLRQSEERYRKLVESANSIILRWDINGKLLFVNEYALSFFGYTREELIGKDSRMLLPETESSGNSLSNLVEDILEHPENFQNIENENIKKNGKRVWVSWSNRAITDDCGKVTEILAIGNDITRLIAVEQELRTKAQEIQKQNIELIKAKEKAEESDRFKTSFIANISHEIRTPMSTIMGFADLLKFHDISGESQTAYIDAIISGGKRMLNIINDLINISTIEAGHIEVRKDVTHINKLLNEVLVSFLPEADKKGIILHLNSNLVADDFYVETDRTKLYQVVSNLVKNALKFTASGSVEFGCSLKDNNYLFYVKDTGIGIPADNYDKVFERFQQGEVAKAKMQEGVGLGLPISKAYVEALGGSIWVESVPSEGSVFYFTIPYVQTKVAPISARNQDITIAGKHPYAEILIADDEESIYAFLNEFMKRNNIKAYHARNGEEAINIAKQNAAIKLVLMDCRMPVMDGLEATRVLKNSRPELPVIGLSALANDDDVKAALEAGCNDYITKPVDLDVLYKKIASFVAAND